MMAERRKEEGETVDTKENLALHRKIQDELFEKLPPKEREKYEKQATEHKANIQDGPPLSHLYK